MIIRSKAPLRIGLAGGGTDVSPYCDIYGGSILNACINMYAYATIKPRDDDKIEFRCEDRRICRDHGKIRLWKDNASESAWSDR